MAMDSDEAQGIDLVPPRERRRSASYLRLESTAPRRPPPRRGARRAEGRVQKHGDSHFSCVAFVQTIFGRITLAGHCMQ